MPDFFLALAGDEIPDHFRAARELCANLVAVPRTERRQRVIVEEVQRRNAVDETSADADALQVGTD